MTCRHWFILLSCLTPFLTSGANWPQFRGPQASGVDASSPAPIHWDLTNHQNIRWRAPIPGLGHSSPILWGDRLYVTTAVAPGTAELKVGLYGDIESSGDGGPQQWRLLAIDKHTGKVVWDKLGHESLPRASRHPKGSHCSSTPATDGKRIVAIFGSEGLFCFDMDGKLAWKKDLGPMVSAFYAVPSAEWGFGSSPVIYENKVIVLCDVLTNSFLAVFDLANGKELWRTARNDVPTWGSPTIASVGSGGKEAGASGEQPQILVNGWHHTGAYDLASGKEVWKMGGSSGDIPVPTPIVAHGYAYFTSAHGRARPIRAVRLEARGDITPSDPGRTNAAIAWAHAQKGNYMQTPIVLGDNLYACSDWGVLTCFDAKSGEVHYSERLGDGAEGFTSSPVSDGQHFFFASEVGNVYVVPEGKDFSVLATNKLGETCMATPAISEGVLYYRSRNKLLAIGSKQ